MASFFGDFSRFSSILVFLFLELICFVLIVQFNQKQSEVFYYSGSYFSGKILESYNQMTNYISLSEIADSIANENAALLEQMTNDRNLPLLVLTDTLKVEVDTGRTNQYKLHSAQVINNSINKNRNFFTLNKGAKDGIKPHQGVLTTRGIVGIVRRVSDNYSVAMSLLNRQSKVSGKISRNGYFGTLSWRSDDPTVLELSDIPKHANLIQGDSIMTSGFSTIFPPNIMVGRLENFLIEPGSNFFTSKVKLAEDLSNLNYVFVVEHLEKEEIQQLENSLEYE